MRSLALYLLLLLVASLQVREEQPLGDLQPLRDVAVGDLPLTRAEPVVRMVLQEANGEPHLGMVAVAAVALDRVTHQAWPNTTRAVIYQPWQFTGMSLRLRDYSRAEIRRARAAVGDAVGGRRPCGVAYWYHTTWIAQAPAWVARVRPLCVIGLHSFYGLAT